MPTEITPEFLKPYLGVNGKRHKAYNETVEIMKRLSVHADGELPVDLIKKQRPNEDDKVFKYRCEIYQAITEEVIGRIITSLSKIRKSRDWMISFDQKKLPASLASRPEETLQSYTEKYYPFFGSYVNWLFNVCLKNYLVDPNGLVVVMPIDPNTPDDEFCKPFTYIFNSSQILDYVEGDYAIVMSTDRATYTFTRQGSNTPETRHDGKIYYIVSTTSIQKWVQVNDEERMEMKWEKPHNLPSLPAFKLGGIFSKALDTSFVFKSRINGVVPHLNLIVNEFSDSQAEVVQHVHSEKWVYMSTECPVCFGIGLEQNWQMDPDHPEITTPPVCKKCKGSRYISTSPYKHMIVTPTKAGEQQVPLPPAGYIAKNTEIIKVMMERINAHFYNAYAACNLQHEAKVPAPQSGIAKSYDHESHYVFVYSVAEDLVSIADRSFFFFNEWRNSTIVKDPVTRYGLLPVIPVPEKYDLFDAEFLIAQLKAAKDAGLNPVFIKQLEEEIASKQVNADPSVRHEVQLILELDPLFGISDDQKASMLMNKGISQLKYVLSCNIAEFVRKALRENNDFATLDTAKQIEVVTGYAIEEMQGISSASPLLKRIESAPAA